MVIYVQFKQSWTKYTAVACIQNEQMHYEHNIVSNNLNRTFADLHKKKTLSSSLEIKPLGDMNKYFIQITKVERRMRCGGGKKEKDSCACFDPQFPFNW